MTAMSDVTVLLITFFMLCTSLSKPQTMEISMPSNDKRITEEQQTKVKASQAITFLLASGNRLFYYEGEPAYEEPASLKETTYGADGARAMLLQRNARAVAQENGVQGRVTCQFVVDSDGQVRDVQVVRSLDPYCDKEAVRVLLSLPRWKPGRQNGKAVSVKYTLPIVFRLQ